jgi:hypothetical protein
MKSPGRKRHVVTPPDGFDMLIEEGRKGRREKRAKVFNPTT